MARIRKEMRYIDADAYFEKIDKREIDLLKKEILELYRNKKKINKKIKQG